VIERLLGWFLVLLSVYFVAIVVYSIAQLAQGETEFIPFMFASTVFGGLAYVSGRFGWRKTRKRSTPPGD
jgi:uncharacterized membrane protein YiaA